MACSQQREQQKHRDYQAREALSALREEQVLHTLGQPEDLHQVQVRPLWGNYFRVNILVGPDAASVKVARSYFLRADGDGNIVESVPELRQATLTSRHANSDPKE